MPKRRDFTPQERYNGSKATTKRLCLRCDKPFMSHGKDNRICYTCQHANNQLVYDQPKGTLVGVKFIEHKEP
jgi:hypothetical protein